MLDFQTAKYDLLIMFKNLLSFKQCVRGFSTLNYTSIICQICRSFADDNSLQQTSFDVLLGLEYGLNHSFNVLDK